jgi:membrane-associated phospholipid phosphatase
MNRARGASDRVARGTVAVAALVATTLAWSPARADDNAVYQLRYDTALDLAVIGGSAGLVLASELIGGIKPKACRSCGRDDGRDTENGLDRWARTSLMWSDTSSANAASNVTAFVAAPATAALGMLGASTRDRAGRAFPVDMLVMTEAVAVSALLAQVTKIAVARERPFVHHLPDEERAGTSRPSENNVSFYSGHTALSFTLASAAGTVATLRGYRLMPLVWSTLMPLAAVTGYLRIAADKHWFTDVLVGMVVGSAVGVLMPVVFHGRQNGELLASGDGGSGAAAEPTTTSAPRAGIAPPPMATLGGAF